MNLDLTGEQVALRDTVRRFLTEKASVSTHVRAMLDDQSGTTDEVWHGLAAVHAKSFAGRLATVGDTAIQVFGGIGYTWEHDAHLYLKRLLGWSALFGGPDQYLEEVGALLASGCGRKDLR
jgi:alkylation response protein AidB-like acyl-CoA dehydrogenase